MVAPRGYYLWCIWLVDRGKLSTIDRFAVSWVNGWLTERLSDGKGGNMYTWMFIATVGVRGDCDCDETHQLHTINILNSFEKKRSSLFFLRCGLQAGVNYLASREWGYIGSNFWNV